MRHIRFRAALPSDTLAMHEITRTVWEGTDYVPFVWDRWLRDSTGYLMVAHTDEGRMVGLQHIGVQPDGVAWVEGIRVAEDARGRGVGRRMLGEAVKWARGRDCPALRLSASSENPASNRIAEQAGFQITGRFTSLFGAAENATLEGVTPRVASVVEFAAVIRLLVATMALDRSTWVYTEGWTVLSLNEERIRLLLARNAVVAHGAGQLDALGIVTSDTERPALKLGLLRGSQDGKTAICRWLRSQAQLPGVPWIRATIESEEGARKALASSGFEPRHGHVLMLHELRLRRE